MAALAVIALGQTCHAEDAGAPYPSRPVRIIVPFGAGGPGDLFARLIAQKLGENLGKNFYIENHPGGAGNIGMGLAARAAGDGYTLLVVSSTFMINVSLFPKLPYDPIKDFVPVTIAATTPNVVMVNPSVPATTVRELVALIRAGKYSNYAMGGSGTPSHLSGELFRLALNLDLTAVPFGGGGPAVASVIAGHTPISFSALAPAAASIKQGLLRALAVTSKTRSTVLPEVPTLAEAGYPDQENDTPQGILAPAGTPRAIVDLLYREIARIMAEGDVKEKMLAIGFEPVVTTPDEFAARIKTEIPRWAKIIEEAHIKPE
ncbi:MAG TPA: tripartite tricarboxylate transporter substrate binding protein [Xanthobacteraceae bacterium]